MTPSSIPRFLGTFTLALCFLGLAVGCKKERPDLPPGEPILQQTTAVQMAELPPEALPHWRTETVQKPALVLLSADALLQPIPDAIRDKVRRLTLKGDPQALRRHGPLRAETLLMPGQTLRSALAAKLFSKVIWVLPQRGPEERIDVEATRGNLFSSGAIDDYEAQSLTATETGFKGEIGGTRFEAMLASRLPKLELDVPAVVHIDLTFFAAAYQNEIKTPLFPLIVNTLGDLRDSGIKTLGASLSFDSLIGQTPLELRFIGEIVHQVFRNPELLESSPPPDWVLRSKALYLENFFQPEKMLDLYRKMLVNKPGAPSVHFSLYRTYKLDKQQEQAMEALSLAAAGDPAYGREYMLLAADAHRRGDFGTAAALYRQAENVFPDDPLVKVNLAKALVDASRHEEARQLINELLQLPWSEPYYPDMKPFLKSLLPEG